MWMTWFFLSDSHRELCALVPLIQAFLRDHLKMSLNSKKTVIMPLPKGLDHLGYVLKPDHKLVRQRVVQAFQSKVRAWHSRPPAGPETVRSTVNSYLGHFVQAQSVRLRQSVCDSVQAIRPWGARMISDPPCRRLRWAADHSESKAQAQEETKLRMVFCERMVLTGPRYDGCKRQMRVYDYLRHWLLLGDLLAAGKALS